MSQLKIYPADNPNNCQVFAEFNDISTQLTTVGIQYERWAANQPLNPESDQEAVLAAYKADVDRLIAEHGFQAVDVMGLNPDHPDKAQLRAKFIDEHTHSDHEVRFFVEGSGLFCIHTGDKVYAMLCEKGDLINVPAGTKHWFDMGDHPYFKCIRLFNNPEGWVANYTGDAIAEQFPKMGD